MAKAGAAADTAARCSCEIGMGTTVYLRSGGPRMTVCAISADGQNADTIWFDGGKLNTGTFSAKCIVTYNPNPS
jgi:uncharacterized protein YodC (DUF2158 family)